MRESREALLIVPDVCYPNAVARAFEAADHSSEPVQAGVEAAVAMAELNPEGARAALWRLQTDWPTLKRLEERVGGEPPKRHCESGRRSSSPGPSSPLPPRSCASSCPNSWNGLGDGS
jgi:hypothetical protein